MVNRNDANAARDPNTGRKKRASNYRSLAPENFPDSKAKNLGAHTSDDLIVSLAGAYENERARQVSEWERMHSFIRYAA